MLKTLVTKIIRSRKNSTFSFDPEVDFFMLFSLISQRVIARARSLKLLLFFQWHSALFLGRGVKMIFLRKIRIGRMVVLGDFVYLSGLGREGLHLGDRVNIGDFSRIVVSTSFNNIGQGISIGNDVAIGEYSYIGGAGGVTIGDGCIIGQYFSVHPENHIYSNVTTNIRLQGVERKGVSIGSDCWIGSKVTIVDGAQVGRGTVIAAGAVVRGRFPDNVVIAGVPARVIKERGE